MMTAVSENAGSPSARRSSVVLPLPRNPVSNMSGKLSRTGAPVIAESEIYGHHRFTPGCGRQAAAGRYRCQYSMEARIPTGLQPTDFIREGRNPFFDARIG